MEIVKTDPAARRAQFFAAQVLAAKRVADDQRIRAAAVKFRIDRFIADANQRWISTLEGT